MKWYERTDQYQDPAGLPVEILEQPGLSLVHVNPDGTTTKGWGRASFLGNQERGKFRPAPYLQRFKHGRAFGVVMRALPLICTDIDGKNGGFQSARILDLPPTLAETSKSGNGVHLFYSVDTEWDEHYGYDHWSDVNGLIPGVDIKGTGIVYHFPQQRWNDLHIVPAPAGLLRLLESRKRTAELSRARSAAVRDLDPDDLAIFGDELLEELARPLPEGGRNNALFVWGRKADGIVKDWPLHLYRRGEQAGLGDSELVHLIKSVQSYRSGG